MTLRLYLLKNLFYDPLLVDNEGGAQNTSVCNAIQLLLAVNAIRVRDFVSLVSQQRKGQLELLLEFLV